MHFFNSQTYFLDVRFVLLDRCGIDHMKYRVCQVENVSPMCLYIPMEVNMTIMVSRSIADLIDEGETLVCVFCDQSTMLPYCATCQEYKGLMPISDWEAYTGESWQD